MPALLRVLGRYGDWDDVDELRDTDRCPVNSCGRATKGRLMCSSHWRLVEHDARYALLDAGDAYRRADRRGLTGERAAAVRAWDAAAARCIHAAEVHARG